MTPKTESAAPKISRGQATGEDSQDLTLADYLRVVYRRKLFIAAVTLLIGAAAALQSMTITPTFEATCKLLPAEGDEDMSAYAGLAGLAGISLPSKKRSMDAYYEHLLTSITFLEPMLEVKWKTRDFGEGVTLAQVYKMAPDTTEKDYQARFRHEMQHLFEDRDLIEFTREKGSGVMTLTVKAPDPVLAYEMNVYLLRRLEEYNKTVKKTMLKEKNAFIEGRLKEVGEALGRAEDDLRLFLETNLNVVNPRMRMIQERKAREVSVNNALYLELRKQHELGKIEEVKNTPVLEVLDEATLPVYQVAPKKKVIVLLATTFGFFFATFLAYFLHWWGLHGRRFVGYVTAR